MSADARDELARRKALLVSRAELERLQLALALHDLRDRIRPPVSPRARGKRPGLIAAALVGVGVPLLGRVRLSRMLRHASLALTVLRVVRQWRAPGGR